jgi:hypothetical protein
MNRPFGIAFSSGIARSLCAATLTLLVLQSVGCTRTWYRRQADADAYNLVYEKVTHPHWDQSDFTIVIDPESRMYDPNCPDHEPMPPDDPAAHEFMHHVDRKKGYPWWHINGDTPFVDNPDWRCSMPIDEDGRVVLSSSEAVRQGFIHSREYQRELEEVYLSSLDVAFERFRFDTQFQAPFAVFGDWTAKDNVAGRHSNLGIQTAGLQSPVVGSKVLASKAFTNGANLVVGFANSMVWQFAGPDTQTSRSVIDFNLIQPLLRGAGRDRVLERLTVSERTLLSNVRAMERYRQGHYVRIMTGRDPGQGPQRRGGVGGAGLEGFTGTGSGFGNIVTASGGGGGAANAGAGGGGAGAGAGSASGYIGLLQNLQEIRNQEDNIQRLRDNASRLDTRLLELLTTRAASSVVLRQRLQVAQARQAVINAQSRLLNSRNTYEANVDNFKITLGLPPTLCVTIQDSFADEYQLIDAQINERQTDIQTIIDDVADANRSVLELLTETAASESGRPARRLPLTPELQARLAQLRSKTDPVDELQKTLKQTILKLLREDFAKFEKNLPRRQKQIQALEDTYNRERDTLCELLPVKRLDSTIFAKDRLANQATEFKDELERVTTAIGGYEKRLAALRREIAKFIAEDRETLPPKTKQNEDGTQDEERGEVSPEEMEAEEDAAMANEDLPAPLEGDEAPQGEARLLDDDEQRFVDVRDRVLLASQNLLSDLRTDVLALQLLEARIRTETVSLNEVNMKAENALRVARKYRHDWLNARASLVDSWRLIEFNADQLESQLDIVFSGDISTLGNNPASFRSTTGHLRAGVQFDSPLTRLSERNVYRQSLIEYQQARRSFYAFEDGVARGLRQQLRQVAVNQINFELQRFAVLQAAGQISVNDDIRADQEARSQNAGDTAARDSVSALSDLLDAQNNFLSVFINYEVLRRQLDLDLGTMQLDSDGNWLDPGTITDEYGINLYGDDDCDFLPPLPLQIENDLGCHGDSLICSASRQTAVTEDAPEDAEEEFPHEKVLRAALARRAPKTLPGEVAKSSKPKAKLAAAKAENIVVASWWEEIAGGSALDRQAIDADPPPVDEAYEELPAEAAVPKEVPPPTPAEPEPAKETPAKSSNQPSNPFRSR